MPTPDRTLDQAEADLDRMIATILEDGIDDAQLERIRTQILAASIYDRDSLQGRAREFGAAVTAGLTVQDVLDWPDILAAVTEEDVLAAAARVFDLNNSVTGFLTKPAAVVALVPEGAPVSSDGDAAQPTMPEEPGSPEAAPAPETPTEPAAPEVSQ